MSLTASNMLPLGAPAPEFSLPDAVSGNNLSLEQLKSPVATVIMFICNHCPFVQHIQPRLVEVASEYQNKGISFIAINSNDIQNYPDDAPDKMKQVAQKFNYPFPYLFDESQKVAEAFQAACTPDFYVFDKNLQCVYRGRFDESTPGKKIPVTGNELCRALDAILAGQEVPDQQFPSLGCNIKWKSELPP